jgi:hypothetical protein
MKRYYNIFKGVFMKRILLLLSIPLCTMAMEIEVPKENLFAQRSLGQVSVFKTEEGFAIEKDGERTSVEPYRVESTLRKMDNQQLAKFLTAGYLSVQKSSDGEYGLESHARVKGGGLWGAWVGSVLGYGAVTLAGHGTIQAVSLCTGPLYKPVSITLTKMFAIPIHKAACAAGVAGGLALGVATGPV